MGQKYFKTEVKVQRGTALTLKLDSKITAVHRMLSSALTSGEMGSCPTGIMPSTLQTGYLSLSSPSPS